MSRCPTRETTKEVSYQTLLDNFKHCKSYLLKIGMRCKGDRMLHMLEDYEVRSSFLKLMIMIMITHIKNDANTLS